jgi:hypothetical protein
LASIFLRAARIISSRRRCNNACLSSRFELHPEFFTADDPSSVFEGVDSLSCSLYLVMRSGCAGFSGCLTACGAVEVLELAFGGDGGGWNVIGG